MISYPDLSQLPTVTYTSQFERIEWSSSRRMYVFVSTSAAQKAVYKETFEGIVTRFLNASASIQNDNEKDAVIRGQTYVSDPSELVKPPTRYSDFFIKEGKPFVDFEHRKREGEILVSNYVRSTVRVRQEAGLLSDDSSVIKTVYLRLSAMIDAGVLTIERVNGSDRAVFGDCCINVSSSTATPASYKRIYASNPVWSYPPVLLAKDVYNAVSSYDDYDPTSLVMNVTAKANAKAVDVLTAMAEMPETIRSGISVIRSAAHIIIDAKHKKFSLSKSYGLRKKRANDRYKARISRLDAEISRKSTSSARREKLRVERKRIYVGHREYLQKTADELATASADLWLNFRYNIMPNVYLAQDIYDAREAFGRIYTTSKGKLIEDASIPLRGTLMRADLKLSAMIKRRFSHGSAQQGFSVISNDLFVTAWELVPLSFVIDWFVNIGDALSSRSYQNSWVQQGATLAKEIKFDSDVDVPDSNIYSQEPSTVVSGFYYKRIVINPQDYCGLVWQPKLGLERQIDAIALLWRPVRSLLLQGKNR